MHNVRPPAREGPNKRLAPTTPVMPTVVGDPPWSLVTLGLTLMALLASGCINTSILVPATPLPEGTTQVVLAHGVTGIDEQGAMFSTDVAAQHGVHERISVGARLGYPYGLGVNGLFSVVDSEYLAVALNPTASINWYLDSFRDLGHARLELPLAVGIKPSSNVEITLTAAYGGLFYWDLPETVDGSYRPDTAQYVTGQVAVVFPVGKRVSLMPHFAYSYFLAGLRPGGSRHMSGGFAVLIR